MEGLDVRLEQQLEGKRKKKLELVHEEARLRRLIRKKALESVWRTRRFNGEIVNIAEKLAKFQLEDTAMEMANDDLDKLVQALGLEDDEVIMAWMRRRTGW